MTCIWVFSSKQWYKLGKSVLRDRLILLFLVFSWDLLMTRTILNIELAVPNKEYRLCSPIMTAVKWKLKVTSDSTLSISQKEVLDCSSITLCVWPWNMLVCWKANNTAVLLQTCRPLRRALRGISSTYVFCVFPLLIYSYRTATEEFTEAHIGCNVYTWPHTNRIFFKWFLSSQSHFAF